MNDNNAGREIVEDVGGAAVSQSAEALGELKRTIARAERAEREAAKARALAETTKRLREYSAKRVIELRGVVEGLGHELADMGSMLATMAARYSAVVAASSGRTEGKVKARTRQVVSRLRGSPRINAADVELVRQSIYFDEQWYLMTYPDVAASQVDPAEHYVLHGAHEVREPGPCFSGRRYLEDNPDVAVAKANPLLHFLKFGEREGRKGAISASPPMTAGSPISKSSGRQPYSILCVSGEPETPGNEYRIVRLVEAIRENGVHAEWVRIDHLDDLKHRLREFDIMVIWRAIWSPSLERAIVQMRARNTRIVFDVDDLMIDPAFANTKLIDGIRSQRMPVDGIRDYFEATRKTMLAADACFATTHELARHMRLAGKTTYVVPNSFDHRTHETSRRAASQWRRERRDELVRIGYAGGTHTHQRDFGLAVDGIARLLKEFEKCRLVLFKRLDGRPLIDVEEYPALRGLEDRIEWRIVQPLAELPLEIARFDINASPLEFGNEFCEAKSELKFFEAALADVPTVASPTGPFARAIDHETSGFLAANADEWYASLKTLVLDPSLRRRIGRNAYHASLAKFGPMQRAASVGRALDQLQGGLRAARAFALKIRLDFAAPQAGRFDVIYSNEPCDFAELTVAVRLCADDRRLLETLESIRAQTLQSFDLVVLGDSESGNSLEQAATWARENASRFNRIAVVCAHGRGDRNASFEASDGMYVLSIDTTTELLPACCEKLLHRSKAEHPAYVYPVVQYLDAPSAEIDLASYVPQRLAEKNYVGELALVSREAWAIAGGYDPAVEAGWEDYDLWCRCAEQGLVGAWEANVLAQRDSSLANAEHVPSSFHNRHPWVRQAAI